tara:strand:- start:1504 stop:1761 length:258 start_codon:yes stop_codon:yes gene_type:complete
MTDIDLSFKGIEYTFTDVEIEESCPGDYDTPPYEGGVIGYHKVLTRLKPLHPANDVTDMFESLTDSDDVLEMLNERVQDMYDEER